LPSASPERQKPEAVTLRGAVPQDFDFIRALSRELFGRYGSYDRYVLEWFSEDFVWSFVAEWEGKRAGLAMVALHEKPVPPSNGRPSAELLVIAVAPEMQSKGVGQALLDRSIALALDSSLEIREMRLSVAEGNSRAQRMFYRNGFRIDSMAGVYPAGQRALFMIKNLKEDKTQ
jgi:ribosomal protein S18 acetylase RimI-like enzyme